jgi:nitrogen fixation NifU-like protein
VTEEVGGLPSVKFHCGILAVGAVKRAIRKYYEQKDSAPDWLPKDFTFEEKQALEEEELAEKMSKRLKVAEEK